MSVAQLEAELRRHNHLYWDLNQPELEDTDYDLLVQRLRQLAPESPVLDELGPTEVGRIGASVRHGSPMLSLDKCYTDEELEAWADKFAGDVLVTPKMDGIACSLRYNAQGRLARAATRGSGVEGDDITANVRTIGDVPWRIAHSDIEVRGEIYMQLSVFAALADKFANPRNLAAGAIKHKDPQRCKQYELSFAAFDLLGDDTMDTEHQKLDQLVELGFAPVGYRVQARQDLPAGYRHFVAVRERLDFEIDGVVYKANRLDEQQRLGATAHHPRYAMAYKFQGDQATSTLDGVSWSVARSGVITPVAQISPVVLSGATVSRASLHNAGFLEKLGLLGRYPGAQVAVTRRGGVIPKVEAVVRHVEQPPDGVAPITFPATCPSCDADVRRERDFLFCVNPGQCRDAVIAALEHFCKVVDIQGFGAKLLTQAHDKGLLRGGPVALYRLQAADLLGLERVGQKLADKLVADVAAHQRLELSTFLRALGIDELGRHVAGILQQRYGTLARVRQVTAEELAEIHTIGEVIAAKVVAGLLQQAEQIDLLLEYITLEVAAEAAAGGPLTGQSFVFTGKLLQLERKAAQQRVKALGGDAPSGVTRALTYLVLGDGAEARKSSKQVKAEKYIADGAALRVISEGDFLQLVERSAGDADEAPAPRQGTLFEE